MVIQWLDVQVWLPYFAWKNGWPILASLEAGIHPPENLDSKLIERIVTKLKEENISIIKEITNHST